MKILVIGNCQSYPLALALTAMHSNIHIESIAVNQCNDSDEESNIKKIENADSIITQEISQNFRVSHLQTWNVKEIFGGRNLIKIPNLFFKGYHPDLCYISRDSKRVLSPLGDYNHSIIFNSWQRGYTVDECKSFISNHKPMPENFHEFIVKAEDSIEALVTRESSLDIKITDYIKENWRTKRLFHTFNHPTPPLIVALARRILNKLNIRNFKKLEPYLLDDKLNSVIASGFDVFKEYYATPVALLPNYTKTKAIETSELTLKVTRNVEFLSLSELVEKSYILYDLQVGKPSGEFRFS